ncbi:hypothetical protein QTP70_004020, partial [Hemibagrus guttatus]
MSTAHSSCIFLQQDRFIQRFYSGSLERRKQLVDQFVQQAVGGTEEKIREVEEKNREVEESLNQLMEQYIYTEYSAEVSEFC